MRLTPAGIREMGWHDEGEWAYMLVAAARITTVEHDGWLNIDDDTIASLSKVKPIVVAGVSAASP